MRAERSKSVEFAIADHVPGVPPPQVIDGIFETRNNRLIAMLRSLSPAVALEVFHERATWFLLTNLHPHR